MVQTLAPVYALGEDQVLTAVYDTVVPEVIGYQTTAVEGGTYDLRIVAAVDLPEESTAFGMKIEFRYTQGRKEYTGTKEYYCRYYYESISTNYGTGTLTAEDCERDYLLAFHVEDCPAGVAVEYTVTTFVVFKELDGTRTTEWSTTPVTFAIAA